MGRLLLVVILLLAAASPGCAYRDPNVPSLSEIRRKQDGLTYAEAVRLMGGEPKTKHTLHDGSIVAEWVVGRKKTPRVAFGLSAPDRPVETEGQTLIDEDGRPIIRRLTFDSAGRLILVSEQSQ